MTNSFDKCLRNEAQLTAYLAQHIQLNSEASIPRTCSRTSFPGILHEGIESEFLLSFILLQDEAPTAEVTAAECVEH
jgi:hypothetical protein